MVRRSALLNEYKVSGLQEIWSNEEQLHFNSQFGSDLFLWTDFIGR